MRAARLPAPRPAWFAALATLVLVSRFRHGLAHPDLWGDEGWTFYPQALTQGLRSLAIPVSGYLNSVQRIGALCAVWLHVPLPSLALCFALIGLATQLAVAMVIAGSRLAPVWPDGRARAGFALLYLMLPNAFETFGNLTNTQWHVALLAFIAAAAPPTASRAWRGFDAAVLVISGVSGPFCLVLLPVCAVQWWLHRRDPAARREMAVRLALVGGCAALQLCYLPYAHHIRTLPTPLGAGPRRLARIVGGQVVLGLLVGQAGFTLVAANPLWSATWPSVLVTAVALAVALWALVGAGRLARLFTLFAALLSAAALTSPVAADNQPQWAALMQPGVGQRYALMPMLALAALLCSLARRPGPGRWVGTAALAVVVLWGVPADFVYPDFAPSGFAARARAFLAAPPGTVGVFPTRPTGRMVLVRSTTQ